MPRLATWLRGAPVARSEGDLAGESRPGQYRYDVLRLCACVLCLRRSQTTDISGRNLETVPVSVLQVRFPDCAQQYVTSSSRTERYPKTRLVHIRFGKRVKLRVTVRASGLEGASTACDRTGWRVYSEPMMLHSHDKSDDAFSQVLPGDAGNGREPAQRSHLQKEHQAPLRRGRSCQCTPLRQTCARCGSTRRGRGGTGDWVAGGRGGK